MFSIRLPISPFPSLCLPRRYGFASAVLFLRVPTSRDASLSIFDYSLTLTPYPDFTREPAKPASPLERTIMLNLWSRFLRVRILYRICAVPVGCILWIMRTIDVLLFGAGMPWICHEKSFREFYLSIWSQLVFNQRLQLFVQSQSIDFCLKKLNVFSHHIGQKQMNIWIPLNKSTGIEMLITFLC